MRCKKYYILKTNELRRLFVSVHTKYKLIYACMHAYTHESRTPAVAPRVETSGRDKHKYPYFYIHTNMRGAYLQRLLGCAHGELAAAEGADARADAERQRGSEQEVAHLREGGVFGRLGVE